MNHTPEPWELLQATYEGESGIRQKGGLFIVKDGIDIAYIPKTSNLANGTLIAAAPELLEALQLALEVIEATGSGSYPEAEETMRAAIAKATTSA